MSTFHLTELERLRLAGRVVPRVGRTPRRQSPRGSFDRPGEPAADRPAVSRQGNLLTLSQGIGPLLLRGDLKWKDRRNGCERSPWAGRRFNPGWPLRRTASKAHPTKSSTGSWRCSSSGLPQERTPLSRWHRRDDRRHERLRRKPSRRPDRRDREADRRLVRRKTVRPVARLGRNGKPPPPDRRRNAGPRLHKPSAKAGRARQPPHFRVRRRFST